MKTAKKMVAALAVVLVVSLFTACGGSSADYSGTYNLTKMEMDGEDYVALLKDYASVLGVDENEPMIVLELKSDGNFSLELSEGYAALLSEDFPSASGTYKVDGTTITLSSNGEDMTATIKDGAVIVEYDGAEMTFEK